MGEVLGRRRLTVWGDGVYPTVQRGVELGDDALLPLPADEPEEQLGLVDCVLRQG